MSLDIWLTNSRTGETIYECSITHNLRAMAEYAGLKNVTWDAHKHNYTLAKELIPELSKGLLFLIKNKEECQKFNASNGWGMYEHFLPFIAALLDACIQNPDTRIVGSI
jgi:hypothetical protein